MPIPTSSLRRGDRNNGVGELQRTLAILGHPITESERRARLLGSETESALRQFQERHQLTPTGVYDSTTADRLRDVLLERWPFAAHGEVTGVDGKPLAGVKVFAVDMDFREKNQPLGNAITDDLGEYEIRYKADGFIRQERGTADLVVRVQEGDRLIGESPIRFNVPSDARVDLRSTTGRGPSDYDGLLDSITPVIGDVPISDLDDKDVEFVAGDTEQPAERIRFMAAAHRVERIGVRSCYVNIYRKTGGEDLGVRKQLRTL